MTEDAYLGYLGRCDGMFIPIIFMTEDVYLEYLDLCFGIFIPVNFIILRCDCQVIVFFYCGEYLYFSIQK